MEPLNMDFDKSKQAYTIHKQDWEANQCYYNVYRFFNTYRDFLRPDIMQIGYGYMGINGESFVRHCYMITASQEVIDPSIFTVIPEEILKEDAPFIHYYTFAVLGKESYFPLLEQENMQDDLKESLRTYEMEFYRHAVKEQLPILRIDYEKYLRDFDNAGLIKVVDGSFVEDRKL